MSDEGISIKLCMLFATTSFYEFLDPVSYLSLRSFFVCESTHLTKPMYLTSLTSPRSYILFPLFHHLRPDPKPTSVTESAVRALHTLLAKCPVGPSQFVPILQTVIQLLGLPRERSSEELRKSALESAGAFFSALGGEELGKLRGGELQAARGHLLSEFLRVRVGLGLG
jgi:hypothetical protein